MFNTWIGVVLSLFTFAELIQQDLAQCVENIVEDEIFNVRVGEFQSLFSFAAMSTDFSIVVGGLSDLVIGAMLNRR